MNLIPHTLPSNDDRPLVSVIIPTYKDTEYLPDALESAARQTYTNLEVIVVDSSGDAEELVEPFEWVTYLQQPPKGPAAARNLGVQHADGEYIAFLDADDEWLPGKIRQQVEVLEDGDAEMVYSDQYVEDVS